MNDKSKKILIIKDYMPLAVAVFCAAVVGFMLYQNKNLIDVKRYEPNADIIRLESRMAQLEAKVAAFENAPEQVSLKDLAALNQKVDQMYQMNVEALKSKVDANIVISLVERVDRMEGDVKDLSQTTSRGALILTAAALTENAAMTGHPFVYEASVLQRLSEGTRFEKSADIIASYAIKGLMDKDELIKRFNVLYQEAFAKPAQKIEPQKEVPQSDDWTDKVMEKLSTLIVIEKVEDAQKTTEEYMKDDVYALVQKGDFEGAILKMNSEPKYQTEAFEIWITQTRAKDNFIDQLNKIKAQTLALIKSSDLEKRIEE